LFAGDNRSDFSVTKTVPSLNGEHTATLYLGMGGGAAGWCNQRIDINSKDTPFDLQKAQKGMTDMIFSVSCGSNVELTWESDTRLRISYSTDENGVSTYQRPTSNDKTINITYLPK